MPLHPSSPGSHEPPIPDTATDFALHLVALRRLIVAWRERASTAAEREARIYRQVEADLTAAIASHSEMQDLWVAVRRDLIRTLLDAMDERESRPR